MTNLQKLRAKIIEEIPEIKITCKEVIEVIGDVGKADPYERPIRLADVLRVLDKRKIPIEIRNYGVIYYKGKDVGYWDLHKNDLNLQSKETIDFLLKIILKGDDI